MKKTIIALSLSLLSIFIVLSTFSFASYQVHYDENEWTRNGDYMYFNWFSEDKVWNNLGFKQKFRHIVSPEGTTLEYYDYIYDSRTPGGQRKFITTNDFNDISGVKNVMYIDYSHGDLDKLLSEGYSDYNSRGHFTLFSGEDIATNSPNLLLNSVYKGWTNKIGEENTHSIRYYSPLEIEVPEVPNEVKDLPKTNNHDLGTVKFEISGRDLTIQITYDLEKYVLKRSFTVDQDMELFVTKESYYINISKPQIIINHDTERQYLKDILNANENEKPAFVPHTIWDLKTDTIATRLTYNTNVYLKQNNDGVMMSYVYIDEYIIDQIENISVSWTSRDKRSFPNNILFGEYSEYKTHLVQMFANEYFEYRDLTQDWNLIIPMWSAARGIYEASIKHEMPRIASVNLNNIQREYNISRNEVETAYRKVNPEFDKLNKNPRYKLWALALNQGVNMFGTKTQFYHNENDPKDERNFQVLEMNYSTNGKLYTALGHDSNFKVGVAPGDKTGEGDKGKINIVLASVLILWLIMSAGLVWSNRSKKDFIKRSILGVGFISILFFGGYYLYISFLKDAIIISTVLLL